MATSFIRRVPRIVTGFYASIVLCLFILAIMVRDEFGFSAIPLLYATCPLSRLLYHSGFNFLFSIAVGAVINAGLLFALLKGVDSWRASSAPK
jgi:hypothetical protein